uniref:Uncharacterized protein n=1 Tax=Nelumbo nucifera TaxID=4432 RepID=A0A822YGC5_NELNU|nr:TPA_asm: hypothetical protein HUJ06_010398 [Nelumbo nucifera]
MFEQQHFVDLQEGFGDPKSWLSREDHSSPLLSKRANSSLSNGNGSNNNVDKVLYKNLVEMVPLVESLMDRRANTSFTRRASLVYTKTPCRESYTKKVRFFIWIFDLYVKFTKWEYKFVWIFYFYVKLTKWEYRF